jgi:hypothetical protein
MQYFPIERREEKRREEKRREEKRREEKRREEKRRDEKRKWQQGIVTDTTYKVGEIYTCMYKHFPALKVPRQCPLVLLVVVRLIEGRALGSEKGKELGRALCYEQRKEVGSGL